MIQLPIDSDLPRILKSLKEHPNLVLVATPGAGKTTRVPPAIAKSDLLKSDQEIIVLQPRRVAARSTATRMAEEWGCKLGDEIGYQVRFENKTGPKTRIKVVTEGILERRLLSEPDLKNVGIVILDEFHERSIHSDLCVALLKELQETLRPDLKILAMSATLEAEPLQRFLNDCPLIEVQGRTFPIELEYTKQGLAPSSFSNDIASRVVSELSLFLADPKKRDGDVLIFLPGVGEITKALELTEPLAKRYALELLPLHGSLTSEEQDRVFDPAPRGKIKVIFSTNIAETSLTIDGVTTVIDSGLARIARSEAQFGIEKLEAVRISKKNAEQRAGRAGRTRPGRCLRLWSRDDQLHLDESAESEVSRIDLTQALLVLADWGTRDFENFGWYEKPPGPKLDLSTRLLKNLGALDRDSALTALGKQISQHPVHPRLGALIEAGKKMGCVFEAALVAAWQSERSSLFRGADRVSLVHENEDSDVLLFIDIFERHLTGENVRLNRQTLSSIERAAKQLAKNAADSSHPENLSKALLTAFVDRLCVRRGQTLQAKMSGGRGIQLSDDSLCRKSSFFLAIDPFEARENNRLIAKVDSAHPVTMDDLKAVFADRIKKRRETAWNAAESRGQAWEVLAFDDLALTEPQPVALSESEKAELQSQQLFSDLKRFAEKRTIFAQYLNRLRFLKLNDTQFKPLLEDFSDESVKKSLATLSREGIDFSKDELDWLPQLDQLWIGHSALRRFREQAPHQIEAPSESILRIQYPDDPTQPPQLSVRLQEIFGWPESPRLAGGKVKLKLELLSPAYKPVQVTFDLQSFWSKTYFEVKRELKADYPRHSWPDNPLTAVGVAKGGKKRGTDY